MKKLFGAAAVIATLAGCTSTPATATKPSRAEINRAEADIRNALREPSSGQFRSFRSYSIANGERAFCADVNSRNGFGGMTGFSQMIVIYQKTGAPLVFEGDPAIFECNRLASGTSSRF